MPPLQDHPLRYALTNELHARPSPVIPVPSTAVFLALKPAQDAVARDRGRDRAHLLDLLDRHGAPHPAPEATHHATTVGRHHRALRTTSRGGLVLGSVEKGQPSVALAVPYVAATCLAPILSTHRWVRAFGAANAVALAVAALASLRFGMTTLFAAGAVTLIGLRALGL